MPAWASRSGRPLTPRDGVPPFPVAWSAQCARGAVLVFVRKHPSDGSLRHANVERPIWTSSFLGPQRPCLSFWRSLTPERELKCSISAHSAHCAPCAATPLLTLVSSSSSLVPLQLLRTSISRQPPPTPHAAHCNADMHNLHPTSYSYSYSRTHLTHETLVRTHPSHSLYAKLDPHSLVPDTPKSKAALVADFQRRTLPSGLCATPL